MFNELLDKTNLKGFFHNVIGNEENKDEFTGHDEVVFDGNISNQFDGSEVPWRNCSPCGWEFNNQTNSAKQVDICVVHSEINKSHSSPSSYPQFFKQVIYDLQWFILSFAEILDITSSTVCCNGRLMAASIQLFLCLVGESIEK